MHLPQYLKSMGLQLNNVSLTNSIYNFLNNSQKKILNKYMYQYGFRMFLKDLLKTNTRKKSEKICKYISKQQENEYKMLLRSLDLIDNDLDAINWKTDLFPTYIDTFTEFLQQMLEEIYGIQSLPDLKLGNTSPGGDFDILFVYQNMIFIIEIKTGPPINIPVSSISSFLERCFAYPNWSHIFFADTTLRLEDKIIPMFEESLYKLKGAQSFIQNPVQNISKNFYHISSNIFIMNSSPNIRNVFNSFFKFINQFKLL